MKSIGFSSSGQYLVVPHLVIFIIIFQEEYDPIVIFQIKCTFESKQIKKIENNLNFLDKNEN